MIRFALALPFFIIGYAFVMVGGVISGCKNGDELFGPSHRPYR